MSAPELKDIPFDDPDPMEPANDFQVSMVRQATETETSDALFRGVIAGIIDGRWKKQVDLVRQAYQEAEKKAKAAGLPDFEVLKAAKEASDPIKKRLPAVMWSGTFARRAADALKQHSGLICVDLDHLNERLPSVREAIEADPHTKTAFRSPSDTGLKVIFQCSREKPHIQSYRAAERYVLEHFGLEIDPACKDVSRLCFVSYDPETFIADVCEQLPDAPDPAEFKSPHEAKPGAKLLAGFEPWDDYDRRIDFPALLRTHGWTQVGKHGWRRPGKSDGISATWDKVPGRFYVFTSSTEFEAQHTYKPWHVYAILNHGGNWSQAVAGLRKEGYGEQITRPQPSKPANPQTNAPEVYDPGYEERASDSEPALTPEEKRANALKALRDLCYAREFNFAVQPAEPVPRFLINRAPVCTPGNITSITAQSKTGKSSFLEAMIAAAIAADLGRTHDVDTLGVTATAPKGLNLLHFDTEQSIYDHDQMIRRALRRAGATERPKWLRSFCLTGFSIPDCRRLLRLMLDDLQAQGGVFAAMVDGVADLAVNVNDPEECNPLVAELHEMAILFNAPLICNLHENPGQDMGKGRGHLGSQIERKAESNLRLRKTDDVIVVFSEKMRRASIPEKDGPRFSWDTEARMHLSCQTKTTTKDDAKRDKLADMLDGVFQHANKDRMRFGDLLKAIGEVCGVGPSAAEDRFTSAKKFGLIQKDMLGFWAPKK